MSFCKDLDDWQDEVGTWADATFPEATTDSILSHLAEEMVELLGTERLAAAIKRAKVRELLIHGNGVDETAQVLPSEKPSEEIADGLLLMLHFAHKSAREGNILPSNRLSSWLRDKFRKNRARTWGRKNAAGYWNHSNEEAT